MHHKAPGKRQRLSRTGRRQQAQRTEPEFKQISNEFQTDFKRIFTHIMKRVATLLMLAAWTAMAGNALAQGHNRNGGGREERVERRQPPPQQPQPQPQQPQGGQRMSPEDRRQLRDDIRQHGQVYRDRGGREGRR